MHPLAHHAAQETLAPLLLGGAWLSLLMASARARLATTRARLTRNRDRDA